MSDDTQGLPDFLQGTVTNRDVAAAMFEDFKGYLASRAEDPSAVAMEMNRLNLKKILEAETEEEMLAADESEMQGGRDLTDTEMRVRGFRVFTATDRFFAPLGHFIIVDAETLDDGTELTFDTASPMVIGKLRWIEAHNGFPYDCVLRGVQTPNGERLRLLAVPKRAVKASASE
jgi:hypothetical protein